MKIYQLHEYGGEWEDSYDYLIGSYLHKERAEEEKLKAEALEKKLVEQHNRCNNDCPFIGEPYNTRHTLLTMWNGFCNEAQLEDYGDGEIYCKNMYFHWDISSFKIKEVEVEE